jgi:signal peptidase I
LTDDWWSEPSPRPPVRDEREREVDADGAGEPARRELPPLPVWEGEPRERPRPAWEPAPERTAAPPPSWLPPELRPVPEPFRRPEAALEVEVPTRPSRNPIDVLFPSLPHGWRIALDWLATIVGAVAIVLAIKAWIVNPYRIPTSSMEPTLHCARPMEGCEAGHSDRVLANRLIYHFRDPHRGEIVVFDTPPLAKRSCGASGTFVKRVIGLPGEKWEERDGDIYINGRRLNEPYVKATRRDVQTHFLRDLPSGNGSRLGVDRIPKGMYLMMGDNRASSCDSRVWGLVPRGNLIGKVFATYWPPTRFSFH